MAELRTVEVSGRKYSFYLTSGEKAFKASRKIIAKASTLLSCLASKQTGELNNKLFDLIMEDFDELMETFINKQTLRCNNQLIQDFDEHFEGHFMDIPQLLYKVILENDRDFFHSLPSLIEKGLHAINERLQANSLQKPEQMNQAEETLTKIANNLRENLG